MEIHQIRYFLELCKNRTFTAAAKSRDVSQPSRTNAIKALEQELGGKLFVKGSLRTDLTALGSTPIPHHAFLPAIVTAGTSTKTFMRSTDAAALLSTLAISIDVATPDRYRCAASTEVQKFGIDLNSMSFRLSEDHHEARTVVRLA